MVPDTSRDAPAPAPQRMRRLGGGLAHPRVIGQAEVVVRAQQQHGLAVEQHPRALRPGDQTHPAL